MKAILASNLFFGQQIIDSFLLQRNYCSLPSHDLNETCLHLIQSLSLLQRIPRIE